MFCPTYWISTSFHSLNEVFYLHFNGQYAHIVPVSREMCAWAYNQVNV